MKFNKVLKVFIFVLCFISAAQASDLKLVAKYNVKVPENFTVHSISGIFNNNNFILAYYAGRTVYQDGGVATSKQEICITRGTPNNWQEPWVVASPEEIGRTDLACFDPVLFQINDKIYLFYRIGHSPRDWKGFVKISSNGGETWTKPISLPENILGPAKCKPLVSQNGEDLICGASCEKENKSIPIKFKEMCGIDGYISFDILRNFKNEKNFSDLKSWEKGNPLGYEFKGAGSVVIQPAMWVNAVNPRTIHALCRASTGTLVYTVSFDYGETWKDPVDSELPSNYSSIDILKTSKGRVFMAWNPLKWNSLEETPNSKTCARWKLVISELVGNDPRLSGSWNECLELEYDVNKKAEYSFPSIIPVANKLFVAYGINRKALVLAEVEIID